MSLHDARDGQDRGGDIVAAAVLLFLLAAAAVALRFYTRLNIVRVLGAEDWTILVALVLAMGASICTIMRKSRRPLGYIWRQANDEV
jgi:hypothetical protein